MYICFVFLVFSLFLSLVEMFSLANSVHMTSIIVL